MNLQETVCWVRSYWLKLEREYVLEWLFTQLAKHVVVGELFIIGINSVRHFTSDVVQQEKNLFPLKSKRFMS